MFQWAYGAARLRNSLKAFLLTGLFVPTMVSGSYMGVYLPIRALLAWPVEVLECLLRMGGVDSGRFGWGGANLVGHWAGCNLELGSDERSGESIFVGG
jgi:hypothetical protein